MAVRRFLNPSRYMCLHLTLPKEGVSSDCSFLLAGYVSYVLVIPQKSPRRRESGLPDEGALQILRYAQDDTPGCHPERSEGSLADLWVITRYVVLHPQLMPDILAMRLVVGIDPLHDIFGSKE